MSLERHKFHTDNKLAILDGKGFAGNCLEYKYKNRNFKTRQHN